VEILWAQFFARKGGQKNPGCMGGRPFYINNAYKIAVQLFRSACTVLKKIATSHLRQIPSDLFKNRQVLKQV
jgi:aromatic ring hydroxylase